MGSSGGRGALRRFGSKTGVGVGRRSLNEAQPSPLTHSGSSYFPIRYHALELLGRRRVSNRWRILHLKGLFRCSLARTSAPEIQPNIARTFRKRLVGTRVEVTISLKERNQNKIGCKQGNRFEVGSLQHISATAFAENAASNR
jgi:hypothetical protein